MEIDKLPIIQTGALQMLVVDLKPNGSIKCSGVKVAAHKRATLPVLGGISGSNRTTCMVRYPKQR